MNVHKAIKIPKGKYEFNVGSRYEYRGFTVEKNPNSYPGHLNSSGLLDQWVFYKGYGIETGLLEDNVAPTKKEIMLKIDEKLSK